MTKYFFTDGKEKYGPFSKEELKNQTISRTSKVWRYGMDKWMYLSELPELNDVLISIPPDLKSKPTNQDPTNRINFEAQSNQKLRASPSKQEKKSSSVIIWLIAIFIVLFFAYSVTQNQSDVNLYKEIVANSYDTDEDFDMYVQKFYRDLAFHGIYPKKPKLTTIKFSKLDQIENTTHIHALSYGANDDDIIEVYINPSTWIKFDKPMRYILMYHELSHDILNLDDLEATPWNEGKLMYPAISSYENKNMDDFIESAHALFEEQ